MQKLDSRFARGLDGVLVIVGVALTACKPLAILRTPYQKAEHPCIAFYLYYR